MGLSNTFKLLKPQIKNNELRQANGDSGDSSMRSSHLVFLMTVLGFSDADMRLYLGTDYERLMKSHEHSEYLFRRTNDLTHWGSSWNNFSRDQWNAMQLAFAVRGDRPRLLKSMLALTLRLGFHQNIHIGTDTSGKWYKDFKIPDISHPSHFSVFIRGMSLWAGYPLLYVLDLTLLADLYFRKGVNDADNMLMPHIVYANMKYPTFISKYVLKQYAKTDYLLCLELYHRVEEDRNGIKGFFELFRIVADVFINKRS